MGTSGFDIIFRGDIVFGHQLADVKLRLQQLFKADAAKIDALFTGRPVPLKRNLDEPTANKYRDALLKAGAMVDVCSSDKSPANAPTKPVAPARAVPVAETARSEWTLAPVGADLLPASERSAQIATPKIDTGGLSLRPAEGNLVDSREIPKEPAAPVDIPDLDLAAVGDHLISPEEKFDLPFVEIDLEDWEIAEPGADLLTEDERPVVIPVAIGDNDFGLAPVGSDLGQIKPDVKPLAPDTSKLRLAD